MNKISVIVPCYNVAHLVSRCLDSILNQSIGADSLEIILVDDASTDNTLEVLKEYELRYPNNIILIACEKNGRQGTARNIGLTYASGSYISFVDSDDIIHKDMYRILMEIALKHHCDIVQFRYKEVSDANAAASEATYDNIAASLTYKFYNIDNPIARRNLLLNDNILNQSCTTKLYKKELLDRAQAAYAEGVAYEEPLFTYPLKLYANRVAVTETPLYYYIYNEAGTMLNYMADISTIIQHPEVQLSTFEKVKAHPDFKSYSNEIEFYFIHTFFAETFYFLKARNMSMPASLFKQLAAILATQVPDFLSNPYLSDPSVAMDKALVSLIPKLSNMDDDTTQAYLDGIMEHMG